MRRAFTRLLKLEARRAPQQIIVVVVDPEYEDPETTVSRKLVELGLTRDDNIKIVAVRTGVPRSRNFPARDTC